MTGIRNLSASFIVAILLAVSASLAHANEFKPQIEAFFSKNIKGWLSDPMVIEAIKVQNENNARLSGHDIQELDQQWRKEAKNKGGELVDKTLGNALSKYLKEKKSAHKAAITEIFIMDNKGLNVGQSDITSDYMQGDEAKWKKTYGTGKDTVFVDDVEFDDSSQKFQSQISSTIVDPSTKQPIGAITVGLNVENLM